jgi:hypothetical protein
MFVGRIAWTPRRGDTDTRRTVLGLRNNPAEQTNRLVAFEAIARPAGAATHHQAQSVYQNSEVLTTQRLAPYTLSWAVRDGSQ